MTWKARSSEPGLGLDDSNRIIEMFRCVGIGGSLFRHVLMIPQRNAQLAVIPKRYGLLKLMSFACSDRTKWYNHLI
jgi:hypothetical protein